MLLFQKRFHAGLVSGEVTLTFRRWEKPHVRVSGRYRCHPIGVLEVDRVERVPVSTITVDEAVRAGFVDRVELLAYLRSAREGPLEPEVYRVELHWGGDGDRVPIALDAELSKEDVALITAKLEKLGPWTKKTLALIEANPRVAASKLAKKVKRETAPFKADVVKLKKLGLTQSFEIGYELSPRGRAYLAARKRKRID